MKQLNGYHKKPMSQLHPLDLQQLMVRCKSRSALHMRYERMEAMRTRRFNLFDS